jgi:hypothetical protein
MARRAQRGDGRREGRSQDDGGRDLDGGPGAQPKTSPEAVAAHPEFSLNAATS